LSWININALERFVTSFRIQLAWIAPNPASAPNPSIEFPTRLKQTKTLLSQGIQSGIIGIDDAPKEMLARCVISLQWLPENIRAGYRYGALAGPRPRTHSCVASRKAPH